ncbi:MAG: histidine kinase [Aquabacterium sp.]
MSSLTTPSWTERWQRLAAILLRAFHAYGGWLAGITWLRFIILSILLVAVAAIVKELPPFRWTMSETYTQHASERPRAPRIAEPPIAPRAPVPPADRKGTPDDPVIRIEPPAKGEGVEISIDAGGIRVVPKKRAASAPADAASAASAPDAAPKVHIDKKGVHIVVPPGTPGADSERVREATEEARRAIEEAVREARRSVEEAQREARNAAEEARRDARRAYEDAREAAVEAGVAFGEDTPRRRTRTHVYEYGEWLPELAVLWVLASAILKFTYKQQIRAEAQAAQAVETAEAESLRRQVIEARMAAMQAQVEPHFLFNTLASIDHLIEVDPKRASQMQRNLIALLRASMPTMREAKGGSEGLRDLGREVAVIRPYLEILKVRMEERLEASIDVPDGLLSAEFPPMMMQTLVENAIKHGLEPKPEGGRLGVKAEIQHGKLAVIVTDTGLGFGRAATGGTGVGLANVRERLQMLYGPKAMLTIAENPGGGTIATITVPYKTVEERPA